MIALVSEFTYKRGIQLYYLDYWIVIVELVPLLLLQLCQDLGVAIIMGKSDLELSSTAQYLRMLIDTI